MQTVAQAPQTRKAYYAHLFDEPGMLFQHEGGRLMFLTEHNDQITTIEMDMVNFLTVLGQVDLANAQRLDDLVQGGAARIACTRAMGAA